MSSTESRAVTKTIGQLAALLAQPAGDREAVHVGQHHVEHAQVGLVLAGQLEGVGARRGGGDVEAGVAQRGREQLADVGLVLDDEQGGLGRLGVHAPSLPRSLGVGWAYAVCIIRSRRQFPTPGTSPASAVAEATEPFNQHGH